MRQRRWLELVKDYDSEILYHPGKANCVADALSRKSTATVMSIRMMPEMLQKDIQELDMEIINPQLLRLKERVLEGKDAEFSVSTDGILHYKCRLCIPNDAQFKEQLLSEAHATPYSVHPGATKMYQDLKERFWWSGELQPIEIPEWKWDQITMDFVVGLPKTTKCHDAIWVVVDRLTKSAHFISIKTTFSLEQLADLYMQEIVRLHGVPKSIVSDRDARFTSKFWKSVQRAMGMTLSFSTAFHPQTDGQSERTIQILEDMLRACVLDFKGTWNRYLPLIKF
ncbi:hypothetical protein UlMin_018646 [Ulmus minor]